MRISRREFLIASAFAGGGMYLSRDWTLPVAASDRVRIGIIANNAGTLATKYSAIPGVQVVAVSEPSKSTSQRWLRSLIGRASSQPTVYDDWRSMLDRTDIDALFLSAPQQDQTEIAIAACGSGKDLLLERPGTSLDQLNSVSKAATTNKRLAAHTYSKQYLGLSSIPSKAAASGVQVARAQHYTAIAYNDSNGFDPAAQRSEFLLNPVEEFDYARGILGVSNPSSVSCVAMREPRTQAITRAALRFEFDKDESKKAIEIDVAGYPVSKEQTHHGSIAFSGTGFGFSVRAVSNPSFTLAAWSNFADCVRSRQANDLLAPLHELGTSLKMLQLAEGPCETGCTLRLN